MSIIISEENTGRELEIDLYCAPDRFNVVGLHTREERENYDGPLGRVFYRDGEEIDGTPITLTEFEDLDEETREELTRIEGEARKLMERAKELLIPVLRPVDLPSRVAAG